MKNVRCVWDMRPEVNRVVCDLEDDRWEGVRQLSFPMASALTDVIAGPEWDDLRGEALEEIVAQIRAEQFRPADDPLLLK